jgi:hypothetical protein
VPWAGKEKVQIRRYRDFEVQVWALYEVRQDSERELQRGVLSYQRRVCLALANRLIVMCETL